jgi:pyruvate/2-oxoglutarate/acetoin dehydrogenase E1 component/TPP-dependent pyruvate/acetoin dehydrogenase alpha subunit
MAKVAKKKDMSIAEIPKAEIIEDYKVAFMSRQASLLGRKEVLSGKAKFGIFGDGKEVAQVAMARFFRHGDWRSGYYRDQTFMFALGSSDIRKFFAQLYADTDLEREPASGGRQMNSHFASRFLDNQGQWLNQLMMYNTSADASPTASQMARLLGLGYASKLYRDNKKLTDMTQFSNQGQEVAFGTIGNASTSEGLFWECLNAACVLELPIVISVWDDDYGISVPNRYQTTKESISKICDGFKKEKGTNGLNLYTVQGWNYPELIKNYQDAVANARKSHTPALIHVIEMTQPQGHSTSGSHERYKSKDRLEYESALDCLTKMREWMLEANVISEDDLNKLEEETRIIVAEERKRAWDEYLNPIQQERQELLDLLDRYRDELASPDMTGIRDRLAQAPTINRKMILAAARRLRLALRGSSSPLQAELGQLIDQKRTQGQELYNTHLYVENERSPLRISGNEPVYSEDSRKVDGRQIIQRIFDHHLSTDPRLFIIGEDIGKLGGVNLEFEGLNEKYGDHRITDTGIREATILGQGIGAALRGLRPVVDIQYLDYVLYCFQTMSDDLASLHYRTAGGQVAPVIVRTKGHRLEGIWHTGSPIGTLLHGSRGMHVCVPRNMVQAAGLYNTLLQGDDPALVIEVLNGYRLKEVVPDNLADYQVPLGMPEILQAGDHITLVTYGACVNIAREAIAQLAGMNIQVELIDVQTLLPFDRYGVILESLEKTNAVLFVDEDVPGGATSYMLQQVLEKQNGYDYLDAPPRTLTAKAHRSPYGTDGDYFTKPSVEDVLETVYEMMRERMPEAYPALDS